MSSAWRRQERRQTGMTARQQKKRDHLMRTHQFRTRAAEKRAKRKS